MHALVPVPAPSGSGQGYSRPRHLQHSRQLGGLLGVRVASELPFEPVEMVRTHEVLLAPTHRAAIRRHMLSTVEVVGAFVTATPNLAFEQARIPSSAASSRSPYAHDLRKSGQMRYRRFTTLDRLVIAS